MYFRKIIIFPTTKIRVRSTRGGYWPLRPTERERERFQSNRTDRETTFGYRTTPSLRARVRSFLLQSNSTNSLGFTWTTADEFKLFWQNPDAHLISFSFLRNNDKCIRIVRLEWSRCSCIFTKKAQRTKILLILLLFRIQWSCSTSRCQHSLYAFNHFAHFSLNHLTKDRRIGSIDTKSTANVYWTEIFILRDTKSTTMKIPVDFACMRVRSDRKHKLTTATDFQVEVMNNNIFHGIRNYRKKKKITNTFFIDENEPRVREVAVCVNELKFVLLFSRVKTQMTEWWENKK